MSAPKVRFRIQPYLDEALYHRLTSYCAATRSTESAVVKKALARLLDNSDDFALVMRRLDRLGRLDARVHRDVELLLEAFTLWVRMWFAIAPNVADAPEAKRAARALSDRRYTQFTASLADRFARGYRFVNDLPQESLPDPTPDLDLPPEGAAPPARPRPSSTPRSSRS